MVLRFSRWLPRRTSWIGKQKDFSNSESLCHSDASYQVSAQSDFQFGRRYRLKNLKMATMAAILWIAKRNNFSNSNLCRSDASHQVSAQSDLWFGRRCCLKNFKMAATLDIGTERIQQF